LSTHELTHSISHGIRTQRLTLRARLITTIGPLTSLGGAVWGVLQPDRITLLHPLSNSLWWLVVEPPIFVVLAGLAFHVFIARPLLDDLKENDATA
jgi:hypothetical protein